MAARPDRTPTSAADAFADLSAIDQALVFDLVAVFLGDALEAERSGSNAPDQRGGEQDAA